MGELERNTNYFVTRAPPDIIGFCTERASHCIDTVLKMIFICKRPIAKKILHLLFSHIFKSLSVKCNNAAVTGT